METTIEQCEVPILYRHIESNLIEPRMCAYAGCVPVRVWKNMNRRLLKLDAGRYFFPLDALDAYAEAVNRVEDVAERIARGETVLAKASLVTYLTGVAYTAIYHFHNRNVQPQREIFRRTERAIAGRGARGEDCFDADNFNAAESGASHAMRQACDEQPKADAASAMTAQQLAEALPGMPWASERRDQARMILGEICAALFESHPDIVRAFAAYVAADGNLVEAAHLAHIGINRFYREWSGWLATARAVGEKIEGLGH